MIRLRVAARRIIAASLAWGALAAAAAIPGARAHAAPVPDTQVNSESKRFADFLESIYQRTLVESPKLATEFGSRAGYDRWDDESERALAARAAENRRNIATAKRRFDYAKLDAASQLQYRVFIDEQQLFLDRYRWRNHFYALNQIVGLHLDVPGTLTGKQPFEDERDAEAYIRRIRAVVPAFRDLITHMKTEASRGVYMPKSVYPLLVEGARNVVTGSPHDPGPDSPIYADFKRRLTGLGLSTAREQQLLAEVRAALIRQLQPAYESLIDELDKEGLRTPITGGVWQLPDGDAFYAFLVRQFTTTDMTPAQIHEMGLAEVARSQAEIGALMRRIQFDGTVREFMAKVKADPRNYESNDDAGRTAYLVRARSIVAAMQEKITDAFEAPAPLPLRIVRTEAYKEASSPPGFYEAGSADGSRPGTVYLNLADMRLCPLDELEDLLYHEGVPGHHMQISTILVDRSIPRLRKVNEWWQDSAFVEGWGLYAERLGKDLGFYRDPYSEFGLLSGELWRASRLVVDSGLHYKHWTREEAIQYLNDNTPSPESTNVRAVDRYLAVPGQATSFMVGMRRFVAERERARQALGTRFDVREYHAQVLGSGYIPLWALTEKVDAYIRANSAEPARAAVPSTPPVPANAAFNDMLEQYWLDFLDLEPMLGLSHNDERHRDQFDDSLEDGWRTRMMSLIDKYLAASLAFPAESLSENDRTSRAMLREQLLLARGYYSGSLFEIARMLPIEQFQGEHSAFAADAAGAGDYPFKTIEDYDKALARADSYARWTEDAIRRMREGVKAGVVLPRMVVERVLPQLRVHTGLAAEKTEFWHPIEKFPAEFPPADRERLEAAYRRKIETVIEPAYRRMYEFLGREYLPHARATVGLGQMPGGRALYDYDVRYHTTTRLTPEKIHALGRTEVTRIEGEFAKVQAAVGFSGGLQEFYAHVRNDRVSEIHGARPDHSRLRGCSPQDRAPSSRPCSMCCRSAEFQIRALPESSKSSQGNGHYSAAGPNGSRPGVLWINVYAPGVSDQVQRHDPHAARGIARASLSDLRRAGAGTPPLLQALRFHQRLRRRLGAVCRVAGQGNGVVR